MTVFHVAATVRELDHEDGRDEPPLVGSTTVLATTMQRRCGRRERPTRLVEAVAGLPRGAWRAVDRRPGPRDRVRTLRQGTAERRLRTTSDRATHRSPKVARKRSRIQALGAMFIRNASQDRVGQHVLGAEDFASAVAPDDRTEEDRRDRDGPPVDEGLVKREVMAFDPPGPRRRVARAIETEEADSELVGAETNAAAAVLARFGVPIRRTLLALSAASAVSRKASSEASCLASRSAMRRPGRGPGRYDQSSRSGARRWPRKRCPAARDRARRGSRGPPRCGRRSHGPWSR